MIELLGLPFDKRDVSLVEKKMDFWRLKGRRCLSRGATPKKMEVWKFVFSQPPPIDLYTGSFCLLLLGGGSTSLVHSLIFGMLE